MQPIVMRCSVDVEISYDGDQSGFNDVRIFLPSLDSYTHVSGPQPAASTMLQIADWSWEEFTFESLTAKHTAFKVIGVDGDGNRQVDDVTTDTPQHAAARARLNHNSAYSVVAVLHEGEIVL